LHGLRHVQGVPARSVDLFHRQHVTAFQPTEQPRKALRRLASTLPDTASVTIRRLLASRPAARISAIWFSAVCSLVETRQHPENPPRHLTATQGSEPMFRTIHSFSRR
jgi:hypothetical protein